jgi:two-component response regulator (ARR-B family)
VTVRNAIDALATLRMQKFDLVVTDLHMPEMNGLELQQRTTKNMTFTNVATVHFFYHVSNY